MFTYSYIHTHIYNTLKKIIIISNNQNNTQPQPQQQQQQQQPSQSLISRSVVENIMETETNKNTETNATATSVIPPTQTQESNNASTSKDNAQIIPKSINDPKGARFDIKVCNSEGNEVYFKIKPSTRFDKLFGAYCKRSGLDPNSVRFNFDGNRLNKTQTPEDVEMEDGDIIDAMVEQTGGYKKCL